MSDTTGRNMGTPVATPHMSLACFHDDHDDCRGVCRPPGEACGEPCDCPCHSAADQPTECDTCGRSVGRCYCPERRGPDAPEDHPLVRAVSTPEQPLHDAEDQP